METVEEFKDQIELLDYIQLFQYLPNSYDNGLHFLLFVDTTHIILKSLQMR